MWVIKGVLYVLCHETTNNYHVTMQCGDQKKNSRCAENEFLILIYKCVILSRFAYIKVV